jgi:hypothetical protein
MVRTQPEPKVRPGDVVVVHRHWAGDSGRTGVVLEVLGPPEHPHYHVRWDEEHESLFWPGPDTSIRPAER